MNSKTFFKRATLLWLILCLLCGTLLYVEQIRRQYWDLDQHFSAAFSATGAVLTQNESVLPLLTGDEDLPALRKKFPQIIGLEKTVGRDLNGPRVEPTGAAQYWLYNPWRQIRVLIDLAPTINAWPRFSRLELNLTAKTASAPTEAFWHWERQFSQHFQPFILTVDARPDWFNVRLLPFLLLFIGLAVVTGAGGVILWQRKQRQNADQRAWYYQHARLNTLGEMTAGIVHEINQPLTAVQTWIQGAQRQLRQNNPEAVALALGSALVQTQRIGELLTRFREQVTQETVMLQAVDLADCWQHVGNLLEHERTAEHIHVTHNFAPEAKNLLADRLWLEQVLHNLLSNAIQAQQERPSGWVHISSRAQGDVITLSVTDGGPGFSPEALQHAFMPFYSGRKAGMGLGMTLTESLVIRMNGHITLGNTAAGGAEVTLQFADQESRTHG